MEALQQYLPITNLVLAFCIIFHLICEFTHYIHSYFSSKRDQNLLEKLDGRLERLEKVHNNCPNMQVVEDLVEDEEVIGR